MRRLFLAIAIATVLAAPVAAQAAGSPPAKPESPLAKAAAALPLRSIGPSLISGRIADIAVHPTPVRVPPTPYHRAGHSSRLGAASHR